MLQLPEASWTQLSEKCTHNGKVKITNAISLKIADHCSLEVEGAVVYYLKFVNPFRHSTFWRT